jgi:hypothetical protein
MSNDTTVYLLISSSDPLELGCALAYLRNKDKTWGLECEEVRFNEEYGYFFRVSGWANENAWNYKITGDGGEIDDLQSRFPNLEMEGYYSDEYSAGELGGSEKWGGDKDEDCPMFCLKLIFPSLSKANGWQGYSFRDLGDYVFENLSLFSYDSGSCENPQNLKDPVTISFCCEENEVVKDDLWREVKVFLRRLHAPHDVILVEECYYSASTLKKEELWGKDSKDSSRVKASEVMVFLDALAADEDSSPWDLMDNLDSLIENDLNYLDEKENNVIHCAAISGNLKSISKTFLTAEKLLEKNQDGLSSIDLAIQHGYQDQLPEGVQGPNFESLYSQSKVLKQLEENGYAGLVSRIHRNFPNPIFSAE